MLRTNKFEPGQFLNASTDQFAVDDAEKREIVTYDPKGEGNRFEGEN